MADMDKRHFEIREGAGLEESRLNYEFIDFLKKWSTPILMVVALVALGYAGWQRYTKAQQGTVANAFKDLNAASGSHRLDRTNAMLVNRNSAGDANPEVLLRVADDYPKVKSVAILAKLQAADAYLRAVRANAKPGASFDENGALKSAEDALKPEDITNYLDQADALYREVLTFAQATKGQILLQINAHYGIAAVAESRGKFDEAKAAYTKLAELCEGGPFQAHATIAKDRLGSLDNLKTIPTLIARTDFPRIEGFDAPVVVPAPTPAPTPAPGTETAPTGLPGSGTTPAADPASSPNPAPTNSSPAPTPTPVTPPQTPPTPAPTPDTKPDSK